MADRNLKDFYNLYLLKNIIKKAKYFKNAENPKSIDLILTNRPKSFLIPILLKPDFQIFIIPL